MLRKEGICLAIRSRADAITKRKPARLRLSGKIKNQLLAVRPCKKIAVLELGESKWWLPTPGNAHLQLMRLGKTGGCVMAQKLHRHTFRFLHLRNLHHPHR